jgi:hypothetical protein
MIEVECSDLFDSMMALMQAADYVLGANPDMKGWAVLQQAEERLRDALDGVRLED